MFALKLLLFVLSAIALSAKPVVVSANTILSDFVRVVGGEHVEGICLLSPGMDPHGFEPKPADIRKVARAQLVVVNGLGLEGWLTKLVQNSGFTGTLVTASEGVDILHWGKVESGGSAKGELAEVDPHAWHDPRQVKHYIENIRDGLAKIDPSHAANYAKNAAAYEAQLDALNQFALDKIATLAPEKRKLVTSHDALGYLGRAYGLVIMSVGGLNPDQEPSAKQLATLVKFIRQQHVRAVFIEATSNPKFVELIAREAGVNVVQQLYTDSLGVAGSAGASYLELVRSNLETIVEALK
jgi:zinc/manganese transport system substrate-binding protein